MEILTSFYYPSNKLRENEIILTLQKNLSKDFIHKINLYITENDYSKFKNSDFINNNNYNKLNFIIRNYQPTYLQLIKTAIKIDTEIICICNSDIEFCISDTKILDKLQENMCYFLTRYEYDNTCPLINNFGGSHDAFIFKNKVLKNKINGVDLSYIDYIQNTPGIEALLTVFFIETLKYDIYNPCFEIKLLHHHRSGYRTWQNTKPVGYTSSTPINNGYYRDSVWCKYMLYPCRLLI